MFFFAEQPRLHRVLEPQDALKAAYQAAFGAEHLGPDPGYARRLLHEELAACTSSPDKPLTEPLSDDICRIDLAAWKGRSLPEEWLLSLFLRSCTPRSDGAQRFEDALKEWDVLLSAGRLPFSAAEWHQAKADYLAQGVRPVHHSAAYRISEEPAYRVINARLARMLPILCRLSGQQRAVVAIDGRCASGKTTLAADLAETLGAGVVHMDDFFLPAALRTPKRLQEPGGNVHYERFQTDVLPYLPHAEAFSYPRFDCSIMAISGRCEVTASSFRIVEGAYSCHPELKDYMTLRVFSDVVPEEQKRRILSRDGAAAWEQFRTRWIPMEERYFEAFSIREKSDIVL
ncbi:MAG: hypothetical protein IK133_09300 [Clostridia bacterium]|nr:hypothetical protein [Clostridia bacterium]